MFKYLGQRNHFLMAALLIWALGEGLWFNLRQLYLAQLGATPQQIGTVLMAEALGRALLPIPAGLIADRVGPHRVMLVSWVLGVVGVAVLALATTWQTTIPGIMLYGLSAFALPALSAYALLSVPDRTVDGIAERTLTTVYAAYPVGLIISPTLGGIIAERWGIPTNMWIAALLFSLSTLAIVLAGHVTPDAQTHEHRPALLLRNRAFAGRVLYFALGVAVLNTAYLLIQNFLKDVRGLSLAEIGALFSIFAAGNALINLVSGRLKLRWGFVAVLILTWLALAGVWRVENRWGIRVSFFLLGALFSVRAFATATVSKVVVPQNRALAFGLVETAFATASAVAAQAAGWLYAATPGHDLPLIVALAGLPVMLVIWFLIRIEPRVTQPQPTPLRQEPTEP